MKKLFFNIIFMALISCGALYAFNSIQSHNNSSENDSLAGHDHAEHDHADHANENISTTKQFIPPTERDPNRLWCKEHSIYEDECLICHPELANKESQTAHERDPNRLWCKEHSVYEDECLICHPEIAGVHAKKDEEDSHAGHDHSDDSGGHIKTPEGLFCAEHQVLEKVCGICQPQLADLLLPGESMKVRLPSLQSAQMARVETGSPLVGNAKSQFEFLCEIQFDQSTVAQISPLANGVIQKVHIDFGDVVEQGQVLFEIASTEIAKAKSGYLTSMDQENLKRIMFEREKELNNKNISAKQDFQQAEAEYQVAQAERMMAYQQLINYGLTEKEIEEVRIKRSTSSTLKLRAPFSGTLIEKHAVVGESVSVGEALLKIADLTTMWLTITIPESQIASVQLGDQIKAEYSNLPGIIVTGQIDWISPQVNENTRMVQARAIVNNEDGKLRQGFYGKVSLIKQSDAEQLLIPIDSVQQIDGKPFVFVKEDDDLFELRRVLPGVKFNQQIAVLNGLAVQDEIVINSSFSLKSEFLKSRFGAGCTDD